jgi:hypothetical protein
MDYDHLVAVPVPDKLMWASRTSPRNTPSATPSVPVSDSDHIRAFQARAELNAFFAGADVVIIADNDFAGRKHAADVARQLQGIARRLRFLDLGMRWPDCPPKGDVSDYLVGHSREDLDALIAQLPERTNDIALTACHRVFQKWLGDKYDLDVLNAMLAVCASEKLPGDPAWLLIISGSGNAKTETVQATNSLGARIVSTISSIGALLSASPKRERGHDANGGLLREIGTRGLLAIKDFTSILSVDRNIRTAILAAFREIHDGYWVRDVGTDGGRKIEWKGRLVVLGACTTAWDQAHSVIASMGDRFVCIRSDSKGIVGRLKGGKYAMKTPVRKPRCAKNWQRRWRTSSTPLPVWAARLMRTNRISSSMRPI